MDGFRGIKGGNMKKAWMVVLVAVVLLLVGCASDQGEASISNAPPFTKSNDSFNIEFLADGSFTVGNSAEVPKIYQDGNKGDTRYGYIVSEPVKTERPFQGAVFSLEGIEKLKSGEVLLDARASQDKSSWSEFLPAIRIGEDGKKENEVLFYDVPEARFIQYRLTIVCSAQEKPVIKGLSLKLISNTGNAGSSPVQTAFAEEYSIDVRGGNTALSFHSMDFIDANTGWVVEGAYELNQHSSKLLRTEDGGRHWEKTVLDNIILDRIRFVNKTTGWAVARIGSKTPSDTQAYTMKLLHTADSGKSWDVQWTKELDMAGDDLWFEDTNRGYALVGGMLLSTRDGGRQWSVVSFGLNGFTPRHMSFADGENGWVIGGIGAGLAVLRTSDGGKHWKKQFEKTYSDGPVDSIDIKFVNAATGWFLTSDMGTWNGELYYTADGGQHWKKINEIRCARPAPRQLEFVTADVGWIPLEMGAGGGAGGLMLTRDGGKNFQVIDNFSRLSSLSEVDFISPGQGWAIGDTMNDGGYIIHTTDGGKIWTQVYPRIRPTQDISFVDSREGFGLGQLSDSRALLHSSDGGDTWENIYNFPEDCNPEMISFITPDTGWLLAGNRESARSILFKTTDGGKTWATLGGDIPEVQSYMVSYMHFFDADNGLLILKKADNMVFYRTRDGGKTWQGTGVEPGKGSINQFSFISGMQGWEICSSLRDHRVSLNRMKDGVRWEPLKQIGSNAYSYGIEFISENKGWVLLEEPAYQTGSRKKLMSTEDGGQTWSVHVFPKDFEMDTLQEQIPMQFMEDGHGWVLTRVGLLKTGDGGRTWEWK